MHYNFKTASHMIISLEDEIYFHLVSLVFTILGSLNQFEIQINKIL